MTKADLVAAVWPDLSVSDDALTRCIGELRRSLDDDARAPRFLATVHRRGFRWLAFAGGTSAAAGRAEVFVGREAELARASALLDESLAGRARVVLVSGEPGAGKTRLAEELAARARARGARTLFARAHGSEGAPPFWIWRQILRDHASALSRAEQRELAGRGLVELAELIPELREPGAPATPPRPVVEDTRVRVFDAVTRWLVRAADRQALVVTLDDVHAADPDSLALLGYLGRELGSAAILLVATYRDVGAPANPALAEALAELARIRDGSAALPLRNLDREAVHTLLAALTSADAADRFAALAHEKTGGNPLYLHELARLLGSSIASTPPASWMVETPETVRQILTRRIGSVTRGCRDALTLGAVAGVEFSYRLLASAADVTQEALADALAEAEAERLVVPVAGDADRLRFAHGLLREILYDGLRPGERSRLHRRMAHALEARAQREAEPPVAQLAHHFARALLGGDAEKAVRYSLLAGERAFSLYAYEEACAHLDAATDALEARDPPDTARLCRAAMLSVRAHMGCDRPARAREVARAAIAIARRNGSPRLVAEATAIFCDLHKMDAQAPELPALLDEALTGLGDDEPALRARLLARLGFRSFAAAGPEAQERYSRDAVALARRAGDPDALCESLRMHCYALLHPRHESEWRATYEEAIALARAAGRPFDEFECLLHRFDHHAQLGESQAVERDLEELAALADRLRAPNARTAVLRARAGTAIARGELAHAQQLTEQALALGHGTDGDLGRFNSLLHLAAILAPQDRAGELARSLLDSDIAVKSSLSLVQVGVLLLLAENDAVDEARKRLAPLVADDFESLPRDLCFAMSLSNLALTYSLIGQHEGAEKLYQLLLPYAGRNLTILANYQAGCASRYLGLFAVALRRLDVAVTHFETALAFDTQSGCRLNQAATYLDYAGALRARGAPGDSAQAAALLRKGKQLAHELGLVRLERQIASY